MVKKKDFKFDDRLALHCISILTEFFIIILCITRSHNIFKTKEVSTHHNSIFCSEKIIQAVLVHSFYPQNEMRF